MLCANLALNTYLNIFTASSLPSNHLHCIFMYLTLFFSHTTNTCLLTEQDLTVDPFLPLADNYFDFVVVPAMFQLFQRPLDMFKGINFPTTINPFMYNPQISTSTHPFIYYYLTMVHQTSINHIRPKSNHYILKT